MQRTPRRRFDRLLGLLPNDQRLPPLDSATAESYYCYVVSAFSLPGKRWSSSHKICFNKKLEAFLKKQKARGCFSFTLMLWVTFWEASLVKGRWHTQCDGGIASYSPVGWLRYTGLGLEERLNPSTANAVPLPFTREA